MARNRSMKRAGANVSACARKRRASYAVASNARSAAASDSASGSSKNAPVSRSTIVSSAPPARYAMVGRPAAPPPAGPVRNLLRREESPRARCRGVRQAVRRRRIRAAWCCCRAPARAIAVRPAPFPRPRDCTPANAGSADGEIDTLIGQQPRCDHEVIAPTRNRW